MSKLMKILVRVPYPLQRDSWHKKKFPLLLEDTCLMEAFNIGRLVS